MLCPGRRSPASYRFLEALGVCAIPIVLERDDTILPFHGFIPWARCVLSLGESQVDGLSDLLRTLSKIENMHQQCTYIFTRYLSTARAVAETAFQITLENMKKGL